MATHTVNKARRNAKTLKPHTGFWGVKVSRSDAPRQLRKSKLADRVDEPSSAAANEVDVHVVPIGDGVPQGSQL